MPADRRMQNRKISLNKLIEIYEESLVNEEPVSFEVDDLLSIIEFYNKKNDPEKAFETSESAISLYPYNCSLLSKHAELLFHFEEYEEAISILERADLVSPANKDVHLMLGRIYDEINELEAAIEHLNIALQLSSEKNDAIYVHKAQIYIEKENFNMAIKDLKKALKLNMNNTLALLDLVHCYNSIDKPESSIKFYENLIDTDPYSYKSWNNLGLAYDVLGFHEKAIQAFDLSITINAECPDSHYYMGNSYIELEEYNKAIESFETCIVLGKEDYHLLLQLGFSLISAERVFEARKYFKKSVDIKPDFPESWFWLGITFLNEGETKKAIPYFKKSVKLDPSNDKYWHELGNSYADTGQNKLATNAFKEALEINPFSTNAWIDFCLFLHSNNKADETLEALDSAISMNYDTAELYYIKAGILFDTGNNSEGSFYLEKGLENNPEMTEFFFENFPYLQSNNHIVNIIKKFGQ